MKILVCLILGLIAGAAIGVMYFAASVLVAIFGALVLIASLMLFCTFLILEELKNHRPRTLRP